MTARRGGRLYGLVSSLGGATLGLFQFVGGLALLFRDTLGHTIRGPFRGQSVSAKAFWSQAVRVGPRVIP